MAQHKLIIVDDFEDDYTLLAIHCTAPSYKMAFLLNKYLGLSFVRRPVDLDYSNDGLEVTFPLYQFEDKQAYTDYFLVANSCRSQAAMLQPSGGLFDAQQEPRIVTTHLIPELKRVDYFMKIESELASVPIRAILADLNDVDQIISAYQVELDRVKSKHNLIFD
jgi:hypothetical protein